MFEIAWRAELKRVWYLLGSQTGAVDWQMNELLTAVMSSCRRINSLAYGLLRISTCQQISQTKRCVFCFFWARLVNRSENRFVKRPTSGERVQCCSQLALACQGGRGGVVSWTGWSVIPVCFLRLSGCSSSSRWRWESWWDRRWNAANPDLALPYLRERENTVTHLWNSRVYVLALVRWTEIFLIIFKT